MTRYTRSQIDVSIVLPSLNVRQYISQCLKSARNQTHKNIEMICVDSGSTDGTLEEIKRQAAEDPRIKLLQSPKKSYGVQMNLGVQKAKGKYIAILETDDWIKPNMVAELLKIADMHNLDFVKSDFYRFSKKFGKTIYDLHRLSNNANLYNRVLNPQLYRELFKLPMNTWTGLYNRQFLIDNEIWHSETPGASYQDNGFWFKTLMFATKVQFSDKAFYMNRRDNSNSSVFDKKKIRCIQEEYDLLDQFIKAHGKSDYLPLSHFFRFAGYLWHSLPKIENEKIYKSICSEYFEEFRQFSIKGELKLDEFDENSKRILTNMWYGDCVPRDELPKSSYSVPVTKQYPYAATVIVPIFNRQKYLKECLNSICNQTEKKIEIICIDDGSTDSSVAIVQEFASKHENIILVEQKNQGVSVARNTGLELAKGEYIFFVDADDSIDDKLVETVIDYAKSKTAQIVSFGIDINYYGHTARDEWIEKRNPKETQFFNNFGPKEFFNNPATRPFAWRLCLANDFIESSKLRFNPNFRLGEDTIFVFDAFLNAKKVGFIDYIGYRYRVNHSDSAMSSYYDDLYEKAVLHIEIVNYLLLKYIDKNFLSYANNFYEWAYEFIFCQIKQLNDWKELRITYDAVAMLYRYFPGNVTANLTLLSVPSDTFVNSTKDTLEEVSKSSEENSVSLSIVIPTYNSGETICETVRSIVSQESYITEIIVVDDCSNDDTVKKIKELQRESKKIVLIELEENSSAFIGRRVGALNAKGEYLLFCDADDSYVPGFFKRLTKKVKKNKGEFDIYHFGTNIISSGKEKDEEWLRKNVRPFFGKLHGAEIAIDCFVKKAFSFNVWDKLYRTELVCKAFSSIPLEKIRRGQDLLMFFAIANYAKSYLGIPGLEGYNYKFGAGLDGTIITEKKFKKFAEFSRIPQIISEFFPEFDIAEIERGLWNDLFNKWSSLSEQEQLRTYDYLIKGWDSEFVVKSLFRKYQSAPSKFARFTQKCRISVPNKDTRVIALSYPTFSGGGAEKVVVDLAKLFTSMGLQVVLIGEISLSLPHEALPPGVIIESIPPVPASNTNYFNSMVRSLKRIILKHNIDTVLFNEWNSFILYWKIILAQLLSCKVLVHCHNIFSLRLLEREQYWSEIPYVIGSANGIVCLSSTDLAFWKNFNEHVYCVHNPVAKKIEKPLTDGKKANLIVWVGRFSPEKRPLEAIKIFREVLGKVSDASLIMLGKSADGSYEKILEESIHNDPILVNKVELAGFRDDVVEILSKSKINLMTSAYEGYSLVLTEAKSVGIPSVIYAMPYLTLAQEGTGVIQVPQLNYKKAADEIIKLLLSEDGYNRLCKEALDYNEYLNSINFETKWNQILSLQEPDKCEMAESKDSLWYTIFDHYTQSFTKLSSSTGPKVKKKVIPYEKRRFNSRNTFNYFIDSVKLNGFTYSFDMLLMEASKTRKYGLLIKFYNSYKNEGLRFASKRAIKFFLKKLV